MPASTARTAPRRFAPHEKLFHTVSQDDFVREELADGFESRHLRVGALTSCCRKRADEVYAVAISRASVVEGPKVKWCKGVTS